MYNNIERKLLWIFIKISVSALFYNCQWRDHYFYSMINITEKQDWNKWREVQGVLYRNVPKTFGTPCISSKKAQNPEKFEHILSTVKAKLKMFKFIRYCAFESSYFLERWVPKLCLISGYFTCKYSQKYFFLSRSVRGYVPFYFNFMIWDCFHKAHGKVTKNSLLKMLFLEFYVMCLGSYTENSSYHLWNDSSFSTLWWLRRWRVCSGWRSRSHTGFKYLFWTFSDLDEV